MSECNLEIKFSVIVFLVLICGCLTPKQKEDVADAAAGAVEGGKEFVNVVGEALTAWETTGIVGGVAVLGIGVWKAISKGLARANRRKHDAAAPG